MARVTTMVLVFAVALAVHGCASDDSQEKSHTKEAPATETAPAPATTNPQANAPAANAGVERTLRFLFTTDEHGWIEPFLDRAAGESRGGVLAAQRRFAKDERLGDPDVGLFSGGDMWTGPYEVTVLEGAPMVTAFNHMGYRASAVGNHEFDFGVKTLEKRSTEAKFPFLSANVREAASGAVPPWAKPWMITEMAGMKVGVVGLTHKDSPETTDPRHLVGLEFLPYAASLDEHVPAVRAAGADVVIVLLHDRISEAHALMPDLRRHGIFLVGAGHAHEAGLFVDNGGTPADASDDVVVCNAGPYLRSYCRVDVAFKGTTVVTREASIQQIAEPITDTPAVDDPTLAAIINDTRKKSNAMGNEVLTTSKRALLRKDGSLGQFVVDAWLEALPYADVAMTNAGGLRQDLAKGPVRLRDVVSVMPFNNYLLVVEITGAELRTALANPESIASGIRYTYRDTPAGRIVLDVSDKNGKSIGADAKVRVVINDFMYRGGDRYTFLSFDSEPEETAIDWREPVYRNLRQLGKTKVVLDRKADDRARKID